MYSIIIIIAILILFAFLIWASADIGSNVYIKTICKAENAGKTVSLTFDDGPDPTMTPRVLDILQKYNIKATFFVIGSKAFDYPDVLKRIYEEGHIIGNHSALHLAGFTVIGKNDVIENLQLFDRVIDMLIWKKPRLFRPPFGVTNPPIAKAVKEMDRITIGWSIRSLDTKRWRSRNAICKRVINRLHDGAIILLHDRCKDADVLLDNIIKQIYEKGYDIKPLDEMLKIENVYED